MHDILEEDTGCLDTEFYCDGICLTNDYLCDGQVDCADQTDEMNCSNKTQGKLISE